MGINLTLTGGGERHELDRPGWALRAPGLEGSLDLSRPVERGPGTRSPEQSTPELDAALARSAVTELASLELRTDRVSPTPGGGGLRSPGTAGAAMELEVPALPDHAQMVLLVNESGAMSWHFPADSGAWPEARRAPTRAGGEGTVTFRIPNEVVPPAPGTDGTQRSLVQALGKKILKVLIHPLTDPVLKAAIPQLAGAWEGRNRPARLRWVTPDDYREPGGRDVTASDWPTLAAGRVLLFVHGTFSTIHGGFHGLAPEVMRKLHDLYQGRVIGFDHPTLSRTPEENARHLLASVPEGIEVDIVCHSRGGLVTRLLQQSPSPFGLDTTRLNVRRSVFGGVPNAGTILTDADHVVGMLDRFTTALNVLPTGVPGEVLDAIILVVKVLGRGALNSLPGLLSMRPDGTFLDQLNKAGSAGEYYAIAADYEPRDAGLRQLVKLAGDAAVDRVFGNVPNDLVVPQGGVYEKNGGAGFPVAGDHMLLLGPERGVMHTTMFADPEVQRTLLRWLTG